MLQEIKIGQQVINPSCPKWGIGKVLSVEPGPGGRDLRVRVNFAGSGVKTMMVPPGRLVAPEAQIISDQPVDEQMGYCSPIEQRLRTLPVVVTDQRFDLVDRMDALIKLYRFDDDARGIFDWAVFQLHVADPLVEFSADELQGYFHDFCRRRDLALKSLYKHISRAGREKQFLSALERKTDSAIRRKILSVLGLS